MADTITNSTITYEKGLVSVIMPFYNSQLTLKRAIELVLKQSYKNLELLIIDDGSTDKSGKISKVSAEKDNRVHIFQSQHVGTSSARNIALDAARGEYVIFCDSDDWMPNKAIEKMIAVAKKDNSDFVCGSLRYQSILHSRTNHPAVSGTVYDRNSDLRREIVYSILQGGAAKLYRRDIIETHHIRFVPEIKYAEDSDFANRYISVCNSLSAIQDVVYVYNRMSGMSTCNQFMRHINEYCKHAVYTRKMALGKNEYSKTDLEYINTDALGRLTYSVMDYVSKLNGQKDLCIELLKETWEMFNPIIDPSLFTKQNYKNEVAMRSYLMMSNGEYENLYNYVVKKRKKSHSPSFARVFAQKIHFRFAPVFWLIKS